ncbi:MAG: hypothetical protein ABI210_11625, partial [Abditibacteriaceae bacterium]
MQRKIFSWIDSIALAVLVLSMCTQIDIGAIGRETLSQGFATKRLFIALPDVMLLVVFAWFVLRTSLLRVWKKMWWPPFPCFALVACLILSMVHSRSLILAVQNSLADVHGMSHILKAILTTKEFKEAVAQILQWTGFFVFAPLIFVNLIYDRSGEKVLLRRRLALACLAIGIVAAVVVHYLPNQTLANMWFSSPNIYGGFLAIAFPLIFAKVLSHRNKMKAEWLWVSGFLGMVALVAMLYTMMDLWSVTALILGVVVAGFFFKARARTATIVVLALIFAVALWPKQRVLNVYRFETWRVPSDAQAVKKQYIEWYVAARRTIDPRMHAFATGIGAGNYQFSIGSYYARLPNEEKMPPGSNNLYLVLANDIGILGLASLLWMLGYFFKRAYEAMRMNRDDWLGAG